MLIRLLIAVILTLQLVPAAKSQQPNTDNFKSFSDWCVNKDKLPLEARHTVEVMLWHSRTSVCPKAQQNLSSRIRLELNNNQISDLRPLSSLTNLKTLDLSNNQVSDIKPLAGLTNLNFLNLSNNQVKDISPLQNLAELTILSLQNNQITNASAVGNLTKLTIVKLSGNPLSNSTCPVAPVSVCQF